MNCSWEEIVADRIYKNLHGRKIAFRYKEDAVEKVLQNKYGIKPNIYLSILEDRIDYISTFPDSYIDNKADEYFLLVSKECICSKEEILRYNQMGFYDKDMLFVSHLQPPVQNYFGQGYDEYGNVWSLSSNANIQFMGWGSSVEIGQNSTVPILKLGSNVHVKIGNNCELVTEPVKLLLSASLTIGHDVRIMGANIFINNHSFMEIGNNCTIQTGRLRTGYNASVKIGNDCMFSWNVTILPSSAHLLWDIKTRQPINNNNENKISVSIGDHCWLGGDSVLAAGTDLGNGSIVGYRSFVNKKFPNNVVLAGTPAEVKKQDIAWSRNDYTEKYEEDFYMIPEEYRRITNKIVFEK